jgi:succinate dehydrogenase/fumarate reductase flavoprotein subunit
VGDFDVAVVGTGLAGLSAALEASSQDATVLLVEADAAVGGRTSASSGNVPSPTVTSTCSTTT